ncbi:oligogalacturonate-specific porin KdgM family protein [Dryocola clanedunensis]|uniref:oligogalacturonate-specific porin KdgM family protein n=1 Tax=Cedecea sulfonylureivorans TaxID=3051154 RepID=UPI0019290EE2|nr:oligogalacturonate-specific porin KdgM family protein [Cedecea sulfonylureivorans]
MKMKSIALVALVFAPSFATAISVDLRHEYIDGGRVDKVNANRMLVSHRFKNGIGFSIEAKWRSGGDNSDQPFADFLGNGHEESISWRWKANKQLSVTPAMHIESNDSRTTYKPNLRIQYNFENGFYVAARYRYDYTHYPSNVKRDDNKVNRGDAWTGFSWKKWRAELNYVYARSSEGVNRNNNKPYSQEYNSKVAYKFDRNWAGYSEVGNIGVSDRNDRQTRVRVGVVYSF